MTPPIAIFARIWLLSIAGCYSLSAAQAVPDWGDDKPLPIPSVLQGLWAQGRHCNDPKRQLRITDLDIQFGTSRPIRSYYSQPEQATPGGGIIPDSPDAPIHALTYDPHLKILFDYGADTDSEQFYYSCSLLLQPDIPFPIPRPLQGLWARGRHCGDPKRRLRITEETVQYGTSRPLRYDFMPPQQLVPAAAVESPGYNPAAPALRYDSDLETLSDYGVGTDPEQSYHPCSPRPRAVPYDKPLPIPSTLRGLWAKGRHCDDPKRQLRITDLNVQFGTSQPIRSYYVPPEPITPGGEVVPDPTTDPWLAPLAYSPGRQILLHYGDGLEVEEFHRCPRQPRKR